MDYYAERTVHHHYWASFYHNGHFYVANNLRLTLEIVGDPEFATANPKAYKKLTSYHIDRQEKLPNFHWQVYKMESKNGIGVSGHRAEYQRCRYKKDGTKKHCFSSTIYLSSKILAQIPRENIPQDFRDCFIW